MKAEKINPYSGIKQTGKVDWHLSWIKTWGIIIWNHCL